MVYRSFSGSTTTTWFSRMTFLLTMASMASKSLEFLYKQDGLEVKPTLIFIWQNYPNLKGICSTWDDLLSSGNPAVFHGRRHGGGSLSCYAGACSRCLMYCPSQYKTTYSQLEVFWPCFFYLLQIFTVSSENCFIVKICCIHRESIFIYRFSSTDDIRNVVFNCTGWPKGCLTRHGAWGRVISKVNIRSACSLSTFKLIKIEASCWAEC